MNGRCIPMWLSITVLTAFGAGPAASAEPNDVLAFKPDHKGGYTFDTRILKGHLREDGKSRGLSSVVHVPTGMRLDGSVGIAGYYRVFTTNKRYGTAAWDWPSTAELLPNGSVRTTWSTAEDRPFEMTALYRWADPRTLDVETTVTARESLSDFESFFASYFDKAFPSPYVLAGNEGLKIQWHFLLGEKSYGDWLMFHSRADRRIDMARDGRWLLEPNPVNWAILPRLDAPLCFRRGEGHQLTVILMAPRDDCFTVAMPHEGESHYSLYLSLFGRDFRAGESARARTRFTVVEDTSNPRVDNLYGRYLTQLQHAK